MNRSAFCQWLLIALRAFGPPPDRVSLPFKATNTGSPCNWLWIVVAPVTSIFLCFERVNQGCIVCQGPFGSSISSRVVLSSLVHDVYSWTEAENSVRNRL